MLKFIFLASLGAILLFQLVTIVETVDIFASPQEFCYDNPHCSPNSSAWSGVCHSGHHQSPINLVGDELEADFIELPLGHFVTDHFFMQNNGHTLNLDFAIQRERGYFFPGFGIARTRYRLSNVHFHWGREDHDGSEHAVDGKKFSMEMHLVHYNEKYKNVVTAIKSGDTNALAVVAIFLNVGHNVPSSGPLQPVIAKLGRVKDVHSYWDKVDEELDLTPLMPKTGDHLFTYRGSLTTPGCNEQVNWFVFQHPVSISKSDVEAFRELMDGERQPLKENHRPLQPNNPNLRRVRMYTVVRAPYERGPNGFDYNYNYWKK